MAYRSHRSVTLIWLKFWECHLEKCDLQIYEGKSCAGSNWLASHAGCSYRRSDRGGVAAHLRCGCASIFCRAVVHVSVHFTGRGGNSLWQGFKPSSAIVPTCMATSHIPIPERRNVQPIATSWRAGSGRYTNGTAERQQYLAIRWIRCHRANRVGIGIVGARTGRGRREPRILFRH